jgi:hypothetical protein
MALKVHEPIKRDLAAQEVGAHVEGHVAALADVAGTVPQVLTQRTRRAVRPRRPSIRARARRLRPRVEVLNRLDASCFDASTNASAPKSRARLRRSGRGLDGDDTRAHRVPEQRGREPDRTLAEDRQRVAARDSHPAQRRVRGAGAARHGCAFSETQFFWK